MVDGWPARGILQPAGYHRRGSATSTGLGRAPRGYRCHAGCTKEDAIDEIIDRLYGLPLAEFTGARNAAAGELRKAGQRDAADQVKALRKPSAAAAAVNHLVREHRDEVEQFLRTSAVLRDAQFSGAGGLAAATQQEREELERLVGIGGEAVRQTLLAAAVDDEAAQELLEARLERELEPRGFGSLVAHAPAAAEPRTSREKKPDDSAARATLSDAKAALGAAEAQEREARRRWEGTQKDVEKARSAVEKARRALDRLHER